MADEPENVDADETPDAPTPEETPAAEAPVEETPAAEETPAEEAPAEEAPAEEAPADEAPADAEAEAPAADAGGDDAPAEDAAPDDRTPHKILKAAARERRGPRRFGSFEERAELKKKKKAARSRTRKNQRERAKTKLKANPAEVTPAADKTPGALKIRQGTVVSDKADKTITVRVDTARRHKRYEKIVRSSSTLHAHDETNEANTGDVVRVQESRPLSRLKRWKLVEVVERAK
jgi:small subunit ribosomal protein S17